MMLVDANLLIYAINRDAPNHRKARRWLENTLSDSETVGLPWIVVLAFLRITTRHGILARPLEPARAISYVDEWLSLPAVELVVPRAGIGEYFATCFSPAERRVILRPMHT